MSVSLPGCSMFQCACVRVYACEGRKSSYNSCAWKPFLHGRAQCSVRQTECAADRVQVRCDMQQLLMSRGLQRSALFTYIPPHEAAHRRISPCSPLPIELGAEKSCTFFLLLLVMHVRSRCHRDTVGTATPRCRCLLDGVGAPRG